MRTRVDTKANYKAIFVDGKTIRQRLNPFMAITTPHTPEIEDVAINDKCYANCSYCYTSATKKGSNFTNIIDKANEVWGSLTLNERPFQIAIGGAGESTIHPDWIDFVKSVHALGIMPNYTTNGMHLSNEVITTTIEYCGGVAVSFHPHIRNVFSEAIHKLSPIIKHGVKLNVHVILGDKNSFFDLQSIYETYKDQVDYIVILPYQAVGRGIPIETHETWIETFRWISTLPESRQKQFAFGALFYDWLVNNPISLDIDIYQPEMYSGYRIFNDTYKSLRISSYNLNLKKTTNNENTIHFQH